MEYIRSITVGILPEQGGSIINLARSGQDIRFIKYYFNIYSKRFKEIFYFSYKNENPNSAIPQNLYIVGNRFNLHRWFYSFLLPFIHRRYFRRCDIFRIMQFTGEVPAILAKLLFGKPFVATYGYRYYKKLLLAKEIGILRSYLLKLREFICFRFVDGVIVTTSDLFDYVKRYVSKDKIFLIPNGVDINMFKYKIDENLNNPIVIIYVGRLSREKNLFMLIDALSIINDYGLMLNIVGDGELKERLKIYADNKGVCVNFSGIIPHEKLPEELYKSDIFVLPSLYEGHPKALLEAMSCGLPCIGCRTIGIEAVIKDKVNGLLCEVTPEDLSLKIELLIKDAQLRRDVGSNARKYIEENFDIDKLLKRETDILLQLTDSNERRICN